MKSLKLKRYFVVLGLLFALTATVFTFSYWASAVNMPLQAATDPNTVTIGTAKAVETKINVSSVNPTSVLVPANKVGYSNEANAVTSVTIPLTVYWKSSDLNNLAPAGSTGVLSVTYTVSLDGSSTYSGLVKVDLGAYSTAIVADGAPVVVNAVVTLDEPTTLAAYQAVAAKDISIIFTTSISAQ